MVTNPIPEDQRFMAVGVTRVVTFACTESGVDLPTAASMRDFNANHFPDTPRKPAFHVVELVPVAEADRLRAIETAARAWLDACAVSNEALGSLEEGEAAFAAELAASEALLALLDGGQS